MSFVRFASALTLAITMTTGAAEAVSLSQAAQPAETPPASYKGDVYVDSRGCAYVRATIGNAVNWVPRLSGDRKSVICGLTPTARVAGIAAGRPPAPPAPPPPAPIAATAPAPAAATDSVALKPATAPVPVAAPAAQPAPAAISRTIAATCPSDGGKARVRVGRDTVSVQCSPGQTTAKSYIVRHADGTRTRLVMNPPAVPAPVSGGTARGLGIGDMTADGRVIVGGPPARGSGGLAPSSGYPFGNGFGLTDYPGAMDPVPSTGRTAGATSVGGGANGYSVARAPVAPPVAIPDGYRAAWDDDRLNPNRGPRTLHGDQQMAATMTIDEVPMRTRTPAPANGLILQPQSGFAGLFVATKTPTAAPATVAQTTTQTPAKRYVQAGMFNVAANAQRAAATLQSLGLPGRVAQTASGRTVVIAGPFDDVAALNTALATARRSFPDAFVRN